MSWSHRLLVVCLVPLALLAARAQAAGGGGNRLVYLDETSPYHVGLESARLTTPQWAGEPGVEAVVVLAIDDLNLNPEKYEAFLRPILDRLQQVEGRSALSIMSNRVKPDAPEIARWIGEGVALDIHSVTHPCPLLQKGDFLAARNAYHDCVDQMGGIRGNRPVAFRMPCCDSQNTVSPRFFSEIFNKVSPGGRYLTIDSSVFNLITAADKSLPPEMATDPDGRERFRKYLPFRSFVNVVENYPYPFVINRLAWEFPCMVPSDWEGQNLNGKNDPRTLVDMKAALDATVLKQGVFCLVFHPHGWIANEQVVALIDHAQARHGRKVKFLNFREAQARIDAHMLGGQPLRAANGQDNGVRTLDLNADGFMDLVIGNESRRETRVWDPAASAWRVGPFPAPLVQADPHGEREPAGARFGIGPDNAVILLADGDKGPLAWRFDRDRLAWLPDANLAAGLELDGKPLVLDSGMNDRGVRLRDLDGDGTCEVLVGNHAQNAAFAWSAAEGRWKRLPYALPGQARYVDARGFDQGLRFADINEDGHDDILFSNDQAFGAYLFDPSGKGWATALAEGKAGAEDALPKIVRGTTDNGAWISSGHLWVQNEDTAGKPDLVDRRSFKALLEKAGHAPGAKAAALPGPALRAIASLPAVNLAARSLVAPGVDDALKRLAIPVLGRSEPNAAADREALAGLIRPDVPAAVRLAAIEALARCPDDRVPQALLAGWPNHGPAERAAVLDALLARADWTAALLSSLEDTCTPPEEIDPATVGRLVGHADAELRARALAVFGPASPACCLPPAE